MNREYTVRNSLLFIKENGCRTASVRKAITRLNTIQDQLTVDEYRTLTNYLEWLLIDTMAVENLTAQLFSSEYKYELLGVRTDFVSYIDGIIPKYKDTLDTNWE